MNPQLSRTGVAARLTDPFAFVAGRTALFSGLLVILLTGFVGSLSNTHFDGVLDTHTGAPGPLWFFLLQGLVSWLSISVVLWGLGRCFSKTAFRKIDLFGTQALARAPFFITSLLCLLPAYLRFTEYLEQAFGGDGPGMPLAMADAGVFGAVVTAMIVVLCWSVYLMYHSYSISCNLRGGKAIGTFVGGTILAEIFSKILLIPMLIWVQQDQGWRRPVGEALPDSGPVAGHFDNEQFYTFDEDGGVERINQDKGLAVDVQNGEVRIHGTTTDADWRADAVKVVVADDGAAIDISGKFRIEERGASGLVFLAAETRDGGPLIYMYQWSPGFKFVSALEAYQIQTRWYTKPAELLHGVGSMRTPGDPDEEFCKLHIHIREDHRTVDFFANGVYQDTVVFEEAFGPIRAAKMELQTPRKGYPFDIRFDDLAIRWNDSPLEQTRAELAAQTGDLLLHYTFDEAEPGVEDASGQMCPGTVAGSPQRVDGIVGSALALDGLTDHVGVTQAKRLREVHEGPFTLAAWFNPLSVPEKDYESAAILVKPGCHVGLTYHRSRQFRFTHFFACTEEDEARIEQAENIDGIAVAEVATKSCLPWRWYHVAAVADPGNNTVSIYLNGELAQEGRWDLPWTPLPNRAPWQIGVAWPHEPTRWLAHGMVDDARIYGRALSADEIRSLYQLGDAERMGTTADAIEGLILQLSNDTPHARYMATLRLGDLERAATNAVPALTRVVGDLGASAGASLALGKMGVLNDEITRALVEALSHDSKWDRIQAATALGRLNATAASPALEKLLADRDGDVRSAAEQALKELRTHNQQ